MQRVLLDTGAFLGYLFPKEYQRELISQHIETLIQKGVELLVPYQVLREAYATLTRPSQNRGGLGMRPMTVVQTFREVMKSGVFRFVSEDEDILQRWLNFVEKAGITSADTFDAYLVATAQAYDVNRVITMDPKIWQRAGIPVETS